MPQRPETLDGEVSHILETVLGFPMDSQVHRAFLSNGIICIADLIVQDISTVNKDALTYIDTRGRVVHPKLDHATTRVVSFLWYTR